MHQITLARTYRYCWSLVLMQNQKQLSRHCIIGNWLYDNSLAGEYELTELYNNIKRIVTFLSFPSLPPWYVSILI